MSKLIRSVVVAFACLFAFGSPAGADTILITSGGLRDFHYFNGVPFFASFDVSGPDFSSGSAGFSVLSVCGAFGGLCVPGTSHTIGIFPEIPYRSEVTYKGVTYPIGPILPALPGGPFSSGGFMGFDVRGVFDVPLMTGDQTVALTVPMVIGGYLGLQGTQHPFAGSATAELILSLHSPDRWKTQSFAVTVDPVATPVPEPASILLVGAALGAAAWRKVRGVAPRQVSPHATDNGIDGGTA